MPCDGRRVGGDWGDGSGEERFWRFFISRSADGELICDFDDGVMCPWVAWVVERVDVGVGGRWGL